MTSNKKTNLIAEICALAGMSLWMGAALYLKFYPFAILILATAVPATVYSFVSEMRRTEPVCS